MFWFFANLIVLIYAVFVLVRGRLVKLEMSAGLKWFIPLVLFGFGAYQFLTSHYEAANYVTLICFGLSAIIIYISPSGLSERGAIIIGRFYSFEKMTNYFVEVNHDRVYLQMEVRRRVYYLIGKTEEKKKIEDFLDEYGS